MKLTTAEVKQILAIPSTNTAKDTLINDLIPYVVDLVTNVLKTKFLGDVSASGDGISFTASSKKIADTDAGFEDFLPGLEIYVSGTLLNDGFYTVVSATSSEIVVSETLVNEAADRTITITNVVTPKAVKITASKIVGFFLQKNPIGYSDNTVGPLSWSHVNAGAIPAQLMTELYLAAGRSMVGGL